MNAPQENTRVVFLVLALGCALIMFAKASATGTEFAVWGALFGLAWAAHLGLNTRTE